MQGPAVTKVFTIPAELSLTRRIRLLDAVLRLVPAKCCRQN